MRIPFGAYRGHEFTDLAVPPRYLIWMADFSEKQQVCGKPFDTGGFTVSPQMQLAAREELQRRGWTRRGLRWLGPGGSET